MKIRIYYISNQIVAIERIEMTGLVPGRTRRQRASNVMPGGRWRSRAFLILRAVFGERGPVSAWTRRWKGPWYVDFSPLSSVLDKPMNFCLPRLFTTRQDALEAEVDYLETLLKGEH